MKYDFDKAVERCGSACEKWDARKHIFGKENVIPLWIADMDFEIAQPITEAIICRANHPVYGYSFRDEQYNNIIVNWVERHNRWKIDPNWLEFSPGVVVGFVVAIRALTAPGDGVVINTPVYPPFARTIKANDRRVIESPMVDTGSGYEFDFDDLDNKLAGAKALLFCNPHNPTGRVYTRQELERVAELCVKHNVYLISDEIHSDLTFKPHQHLHVASLSAEIGQRSVTLIAPSKSFNIAALSTSVAIIPGDSTRRAFKAEMDKLHIDQGNVFGTTALKAAYGHCEEWLDQAMEYMKLNCDYVMEFLEQNLPQIRCYRPQGTYLLWLDMRALGMEHEELFRFLVENAKLGLNDGAHFGAQGNCFARLNLATRRQVLQRAMAQLKEAVDQLK